MNEQYEQPPIGERGPAWNRTALIASHNWKSLLREWNEAYPEETFELQPWRRSLRAPSIAQSLEDIQTSTFPDLNRQGVNLTDLNAALYALLRFPVPDAESKEKIQVAMDALDKGILAIDQLARDGLLPGRLTQETIRAGSELLWEVCIPPLRLHQGPQGPSEQFLARIATRLIGVLGPTGDNAHLIAAGMLSVLGFPVTEAEVKSFVASLKRDEQGTEREE